MPNSDQASAGVPNVGRVHPERDARTAEPLLTLRQAADYLSVSVPTVRLWVKDGSLRHGRVGIRGDLRFARADLDARIGLA